MRSGVNGGSRSPTQTRPRHKWMITKQRQMWSLFVGALNYPPTHPHTHTYAQFSQPLKRHPKAQLLPISICPDEFIIPFFHHNTHTHTCASLSCPTLQTTHTSSGFTWPPSTSDPHPSPKCPSSNPSIHPSLPHSHPSFFCTTCAFNPHIRMDCFSLSPTHTHTDTHTRCPQQDNSKQQLLSSPSNGGADR